MKGDQKVCFQFITYHLCILKQMEKEKLPVR